jgi:tRNA (cytidine/uridine-2'-O-)-methyltransferase
MFHVVLYEPEIPANTGNIIRLCANTGTQLHLIKPLGFDLDDKKLRRAGLDYHEWAPLRCYPALDECLMEIGSERVFALTTKGLFCYAEMQYRRGDVLLFGPETRGLPDSVLKKLSEKQRIRLPMAPSSRSLNLSNTAAVVVYEALRQVGFAGIR